MKYLLILVALIVVLGGAGVLFGMAPAKNMALKIVNDELKTSLPCKYKLGGITAGFPRGVELQNLRLYDPASGAEFLNIHSLRLTLGLVSLLHPKNPFTGVVVEQGKALIVRDSAGQINIIRIMEKMEKKKTTEATIPRVTLNGIQIEWNDYKPGNSPPREKFNLIHAEIGIGDNGEYSLRGIRVQKGSTVVTLRGNWNETPGSRVDLRLRADPLKVKDVLEIVRGFSGDRSIPTLHLDGEGTFDGRMSGARGKEQEEGVLSLENGTLGPQKLRQLRRDFGPGSGGQMEVRDADVRMDGGGRLTAEGSFSLDAPFKFRMKGNSDHFPVDALIGVVNPQPMLTGAMDAEFTVQGNAKDLKTAAGEGKAVIRKGNIFGVKGEGQPPIQYRAMQASFKAENGILKVSDGVLDSDELLLQLQGNIGLDRSLDLNGKCEVAKHLLGKGFFKKIILSALPDGSVGYRFPIHIHGTIDNPEIAVRKGKLAEDSVTDKVRDAGNKVEKLFKKYSERYV